jgi:hypothetical protein
MIELARRAGQGTEAVESEWQRGQTLGLLSMY